MIFGVGYGLMLGGSVFCFACNANVSSLFIYFKIKLKRQINQKKVRVLKKYRIDYLFSELKAEVYLKS